MQTQLVSGKPGGTRTAYSSALSGRFDKDERAYWKIVIGEQVGCVSLNGDIGLVNREFALRVHGYVGHSDGSVKGGHLLSAVALRMLKVFATGTEVPLHKQQYPTTTLEHFKLNT